MSLISSSNYVIHKAGDIRYERLHAMPFPPTITISSPFWKTVTTIHNTSGEYGKKMKYHITILPPQLIDHIKNGKHLAKQGII